MSTPTQNSIGGTNVSLSGDSEINSLIDGVRWEGGLGSGVSLTYSIIRGTSYWQSPYSTNDEPGFNSGGAWSSISTAQEAAVDKALQTLAAVANVQFQKVDDNQDLVGDIRIAKSINISDENSAWAYTPGDTPASGDIWLNADDFPSTKTAAPGSFEFYVLIHESGHTLGLKHPFETGTNSSAILDQSLDNNFFTIMSYTHDLDNEGFIPDRYPTTPMLLDIQALQYLYGPNHSYNAGNTTYTFSSSGTYFLTLWDGGGTDTIKYDSAIGGVIDLNEGGWSELGQPIEFKNSAGVFQYEVAQTVMIAYGANIENATGGGGADHLIGNDLGNTLRGGAGNDTLEGWDGNDYLVGGTGADTMYGDDGNDTYTIDSALEIQKGIVDNGVDTVRSSISYGLGSQQERLTLLGAANLNGTGNAQANILTGNGGANVLSGGLGSDQLNGAGGNDLLAGNGGNDTYVVDGANEINRATADPGVDTVQSTVSYTLGGQQERLTLLGSANLSGTGNALDNLLRGNGGVNVLNGGLGNDTLDGGAGVDHLRGNEGNDVYLVDDAREIDKNITDVGIDTVRSTVNYTLGVRQEVLVLLGTGDLKGSGNAENNTLNGNGGANTLDGAAGNDTLSGASGDDSLIGGSGKDVLDGGSGNDVLVGGTGKDLLTGGSGEDVFKFKDPLAAKKVDVIEDFSNSGENDTIRLDNDIFTALVSLPGALSPAEFKAVPGGMANEVDDRILYDTDTGALYYDADGSDGVLPVKFAILTGHPVIDSTDFIVSN